MKTFLFKAILFCLILFISGCKEKYDKEKFLKFDHLYFSDKYRNNMNKYLGEIEPIAKKINSNSKLNYQFNNIPPNSVFSYPFEVNFEHIKENKYKSYIFRLYRKDDAIFYLNRYEALKKDIPELPSSVKKTIYRNLALAKKIIEECKKKNINVVKSDFNTKFYNEYYSKYLIGGRDVYIKLENCNDKEAKLVVDHINNDEKFSVRLKEYSENINFHIIELTKIHKLKEGKSNFLLFFDRSFSGFIEIRMSLENGIWKYQLLKSGVY